MEDLYKSFNDSDKLYFSGKFSEVPESFYVRKLRGVRQVIDEYKLPYEEEERFAEHLLYELELVLNVYPLDEDLIELHWETLCCEDTLGEGEMFLASTRILKDMDLVNYLRCFEISDENVMSVMKDAIRNKGKLYEEFLRVLARNTLEMSLECEEF